MDYKFPTNITLTEVKEEIKDSKEFIIVEKDLFTVVNYTHCTADTFDTPLKAELRGLIFDTKTGKVLSRRFHKFFNVGEKLDSFEFDMSKPHRILDKIDGSMISPVLVGEGLRWTTKMGITDVSMKAETFLADKEIYTVWCKAWIKNGYTPIFEYTAPDNRIVLDYKEEQVTLLAIRDNETGSYVPYRAMQVATADVIPLVKAIEFSGKKTLGNDTMGQLVDHTRGLEDVEGYVIIFDDGHMVKIKAEWYVKLHRAKEVLSNEKRLIQLFLDDDLDDVIPLLMEEDKKKVLDLQKKFWDSINESAEILIREFSDYCTLERKDYALDFVAKMPSCTKSILFKMYEDTPAVDAIVDYVGKAIGTKDKLANTRMLLGGFRYE